ncbi:MAG TPA: hypothetical protein VF331_23025 [Polyangiales bacterium]
MFGILFTPVLIQASAMLADEGWFHRRRGLPRWERIGHPLDTLTTALCYGWLVSVSPQAPHALAVYIGLALFSCLFITKDEFIHAKVCSPTEGWLHSLLFVIHPVVLMAFGYVWRSAADAAHWVLRAQLLITLAFATYQIWYWSVFCKPSSSPRLSAP